MKKEFIISCFLVLMLGCSDIENCGTNQDSPGMIVRFYDINTKSSKVAKKVGFSIGSGSVLYGSSFFSEDSTGVFLPLNPNEESVSFFFISDTSAHQLEVNYSKEFSLLDPDCEPSLTFTNLDTVRQTFDSAVVVSTITNIFIDPNIEIYF